MFSQPVFQPPAFPQPAFLQPVLEQPALEQPPERARRAAVARYLSAALFGAFLAYYGLLCFRHEWGGDFQMNCAAIAQLYRNFTNPSHEAMNVAGAQSTVYNVYVVILAALGKLFSLSAYRVLQLAGVFNLLLYAAAICYFCSRHSLHRRWWLAAACWLYASLFLRWHNFGWSSETSVWGLQYLQAFPSTHAWALAFLAFGLMVDLARSSDNRLCVALALLLGLVLCTHVLTASWVIGIVGLHACWEAAWRRNWRLLVRPLAAILVAVGLAAVWPYAPLFNQRSMTGINEGSVFGVSPFHDLPNLYALAIPCSLYLLIRLRRHAFWLLACLVSLGVLAVWRHVGYSFGNRYAFFAAFCAQFVVAEVLVFGVYALLGPLRELGSSRRWPWLDRPFSALILGVSLVVWVPAPLRDAMRQMKSPLTLLRQSSPHDAYYQQFGEVTALLSPADLVLMPVSRTTFDLATVTGASVISSPNAWQVPDRVARQRDVQRFFDRRATKQERSAIAKRRGANKILLPASHRGLAPALTAQFGKPLREGKNYWLWAI